MPYIVSKSFKQWSDNGVECKSPLETANSSWWQVWVRVEPTGIEEVAAWSQSHTAIFPGVTLPGWFPAQCPCIPSITVEPQKWKGQASWNPASACCFLLVSWLSCLLVSLALGFLTFKGLLSAELHEIKQRSCLKLHWSHTESLTQYRKWWPSFGRGPNKIVGLAFLWVMGILHTISMETTVALHSYTCVSSLRLCRKHVSHMLLSSFHHTPAHSTHSVRVHATPWALCGLTSNEWWHGEVKLGTFINGEECSDLAAFSCFDWASKKDTRFTGFYFSIVD